VYLLDIADSIEEGEQESITRRLDALSDHTESEECGAGDATTNEGTLQTVNPLPMLSRQSDIAPTVAPLPLLIEGLAGLEIEPHPAQRLTPPLLRG
jgi:hypothetical protein